MAKRKAYTVFDGDSDKKLPDNTKLKKILIAAIIILAITALIVATVFLVKYFGTHRLTTSDGGVTLVNRRTNVTYELMIICPYTVNVAFDQVYAECDGTEYYKIAYMDTDGKEKFFDPEKMIAAVDEYKNVDLYIAKGFEFPSFDELEPISTVAYLIDVESQKVGQFGETDTQTIMSVLKEGTSVYYPIDIDTESFIQLCLWDPNHPYFWYTVDYFETESGDKYLRDTSLDKCIEATEQLSTVFGSEE